VTARSWTTRPLKIVGEIVDPLVRSSGEIMGEMVPYIFTYIFLVIRKCSIHVKILPDIAREIRESSMER